MNAEMDNSLFEGVSGWLLRKFIRIWVPFFLLGSIGAILITSIQAAQWVRNDSVIVLSIVCGLTFGWLLSISHFPGWFAVLFNVVLAPAVVFSGMANIFALIQPGIFQTPFTDLLTTMNLRAFTLIYRVTAWRQAILTNNPVNDTGFFVLLVSLLVWAASAWLAWATIRRNKALEGIIPAGLLLALNVHMANLTISYFVGYVILALLLAVRSTYLWNTRDWDRRQVDYPDSVELDWTMVALALSFVIGMAASASTVLATPEGWESLSKLFRPAQEQTQNTAEKLFAGVNPPRAAEYQLRALTPDMRNFGYPLPTGTDTILWVKTSDPPPPPREANIPASAVPRHYWRSTVYTTYTIYGWQISDAFDSSPPSSAQANAPPGRYSLKQEFDIVAAHGLDLFSANQPITVNGGPMLRNSQPDDTTLVSGRSSTYQVTSLVSRVSANDLDAASTSYPPEISKVYLQLPQSIPGRVKQLADQIVARDRTPFQKALHIQNYLRETYAYRQDINPPDKGKDFVDNFLFLTQAGYCSHFSTSMAVMLRMEGVPARVVSGYATGEYDQTRGAYRVTANEAHAWVEVYFPGYGWVEFEPTPSQPAFNFPRLNQNQEMAPLPVVQQEPGPNPWLWMRWALLGAAVALVFLAVGWLLVSRLRLQVLGGQAGQIYWSIRRWLAWLGLNSTASTTPGEFLERSAPVLARRGRMMQMVRDITDLYQQAAFSAHPPEQQTVDHARRAWQSAWIDWLALWLKRLAVAARRLF